MKQNPFEGKQIWFFTGSQELYGPETLDQVAAQSQQVVDQLNESGQIPVSVVWKPVLKDAASIRRAVLDANSADECVGVMVWMHTFSPAKMWLTGLDALSTPLLHFHTQANVELPWAEIDMDFMNLNQAAHGDREFGYVATRLGVPRKVVVGHATQKAAQSQIGTWARAATAWADLRNAHLVRFGDNMRNVAVTEGDKTEAELRFGIAVNTWGVNELVERVDAASPEDIDRLIEEYEASYEIAPELSRGGERHASLRYGAAIELGMRSFLEEKNAVAFTTNFEDLGGLRQLPGLAVQRLMAEGYGFGAEGDWKTAILVRVAKVMGYGLPGGASLMEDYTYHMAEGAEKILGAHMLEVCPSLTETKPKLEIHPLGIGDREDPVRLVFNTDSGPGIVVSLADMRERFRLTANVVNVVQPDEDLPNLPVARAVWEPEPNFAISAAAWLHAGGAHHTAMSTAVGVEAFEDFADIAQVEFLVIDQDTTVRNFIRELSWNAAYYRLAQGL